MVASVDGSNGCTTIRLGSGIERPASWFSGIFDPYASTCTLSSRPVEARPVRTFASSFRTCSTPESMRCLISAKSPLRSVASMLSSERPRRSGPDDRADRLAEDRAPQVAGRAQIEHQDGQLVVHAE